MGFLNVSFPATTPWGHLKEHWDAFVNRGLLSPNLWSRLQSYSDTTDEGFIKYAANALSQIQSKRKSGVEGGAKGGRMEGML